MSPTQDVTKSPMCIYTCVGLLNQSAVRYALAHTRPTMSYILLTTTSQAELSMKLTAFPAVKGYVLEENWSVGCSVAFCKDNKNTT